MSEFGEVSWDLYIIPPVCGGELPGILIHSVSMNVSVVKLCTCGTLSGSP